MTIVAGKVRGKDTAAELLFAYEDHTPGQQCRTAQACCLLLLAEIQQRWCLYSQSWFRLI